MVGDGGGYIYIYVMCTERENECKKLAHSTIDTGKVL